MKRENNSVVPLIALLAMASNAQVTVVNNANDPGVITSFWSYCPTGTTTTITLPTTITMCPGPNCNGGAAPVITPPPTGPARGGIHLGEYTSVGPDGKTTILGIYETVLDAMGDDGMTQVTYTITEPCPTACHKTMDPTVLPIGFETTVVPCHVCEKTGGPTTITLTQPCPTGPYASQTPSPSAQGTATNPSSDESSGTNDASGAPTNSDTTAGNENDMNECSGTEGCADSHAGTSSGMKSNGTSSPSDMVYLGFADRTTYGLSTVLLGALAYIAVI